MDILDAIILAEKINLDQTGNVFIAKDTRQSSEVSHNEAFLGFYLF